MVTVIIYSFFSDTTSETSYIKDMLKNYGLSLLWENSATISSWTVGKKRGPGVHTLSSDITCAVTNNLATSVRKAVIFTNPNYLFAVNCYTETSGSSSNFIKSFGWLNANELVVFPQEAKAVIIMVKSIDGHTITSDESSTISAGFKFFYPTDKNLSTEYKAADAKAVGDALDNLNSGIFTYIGANSLSSYNSKLANVSGNGINATINVTSGYDWEDKPVKNCMFITKDINGIFSVQIAISTDFYLVYHRIIRNATNEVYRDWELSGDGEKYTLEHLKVLVVGDSIARGGRNSGKGFIGDVGCAYVNMAVGGATLSTAVVSTGTDSSHPIGAVDIPDQLVKYATKTNEDYYIKPDVIIAEGGINDASHNAPLGTIPTSPVRTDTDAEALDRSTVLGGLQYLFYQMIKLYPKAYRFFLTMNRVNTRPWTPYSSGMYTQTELNEAIKQTCAVYSVRLIDVFNESILNSYFSEYVSPTSYNSDHSVTNLYCIDNDKLHPLALGYKIGYVPLVTQALRSIISII